MKLTKGISLLLIVCMLLTSLGTITFAAETARYSLSLSGPITVRGEQATISVLKETVNDETKVHSAATVVSGVTFTSSDENVLTIGADGKITAKKVGTATIKATAPMPIPRSRLRSFVILSISFNATRCFLLIFFVVMHESLQKPTAQV